MCVSWISASYHVLGMAAADLGTSSRAGDQVMAICGTVPVTLHCCIVSSDGCPQGALLLHVNKIGLKMSPNSMQSSTVDTSRSTFH